MSQLPQTKIDKEISEFVSQITSLKNIFPAIIDNIENDFASIDRQFDLFKSKNLSKEEIGEKHPMPLYKRTEYIKLKEKYEQTKFAIKNVPPYFILSLIAHYDSFLRNLFRELFYLKPEMLNSIQRSLSYSELNGLKSITEARDFIIEKEIDSFMRESHYTQLDLLDRRIGTSLIEGLGKSNLLPKFIELTERRNLYAHTGGIVSNYYLTQQKIHFSTLDFKFNIGQYILSDKEYVEQAYATIFEVGVRISQICWRKLLKGKAGLDMADDMLKQITYELLVLGKYKLANKLLVFATSLGKYNSERNRLIFIVNLAQSFKWLGDEGSCKSTLEDVDWSACENAYALSVAVLLEDYDKAIGLLELAVHAGEVKEANLRDWPVYQKFRGQEIFKTKFKELFNNEI